ncbi:diacylglycerol/lipid kinase family protein [Streptomyces sp. NPDC020965]|uniref:diacylglycerol/lipid kinase family protein n=1 Tax=Streptomyces sp. NPDC020965 TaxID=3365105 RepID=UPI0037A9B6E8
MWRWYERERVVAVADPGTLRWARVLARLALAGVAAAIATLVSVVSAGGLLIVAGGLAGLALAAVGTWWVLAYRGPYRLLGALLVLAAPVAVIILYTVHGLWGPALVAMALWGAALGCARSALRRARPPRGPRARYRRPPRHPVLIMNPVSGGGKVTRFGLVEKAERLGARVIVLSVTTRVDVTALARQAVADGADLLGVAGGDGTQALVAAVAAEHDLPFLVISAGTRNHFALDLGLDRQDPSRCLDALTDGEEIRVDLGFVSGRPFVNTASFGVYAEIVQSPRYREDQAGTALDALPDLLLKEPGKRLDATVDGTRLPSQQALLVSNNPYASGDLLGAGRRLRLDGGRLGVIGIRVDGAAQAAQLALLGAQATGLTVLTARQVRVTAAAAASDLPVTTASSEPPATAGASEPAVAAGASNLPVAVDGEALTLPAPVVCSIHPRALRVLVPRGRPGAPMSRPRLNWRQIALLALGRPVPVSDLATHRPE